MLFQVDKNILVVNDSLIVCTRNLLVYTKHSYGANDNNMFFHICIHFILLLGSLVYVFEKIQ